MWVQLDHDFGLPYVTLVVNARKVLADGVAFPTYGSGKEPNLPALAKELEAYVEKYRPKLKGCRVVGISHHGGSRLRI